MRETFSTRSFGRMRTLFFLAALLFAPAANAQTLEDLHWLKGCWRTSGDGPVITEVWSAPPMPALVGYSYTTRDGQVREWEQMRIEALSPIHVVLVAMPSGGDPVRFERVPVMGVADSPAFRGHLVFENEDHDFPQRIVYRGYTDSLTATISRIDGSNAMTFEYRRIPCSGDLRP